MRTAPGGEFNLELELMGPDNLVAIVVGVAEGNRTCQGLRTRNYYGHLDPATDTLNLGSFSVQAYLFAGVDTPEKADHFWLEQMRAYLLEPYLDVCIRQKIDHNDPLLALSVCDLYTQSPAAVHSAHGLLDLITPECLGNPEAIVNQRVESFYTPDGRLDAPGFFNDRDRLEINQRTRTQLIVNCLKSRGLI